MGIDIVGMRVDVVANCVIDKSNADCNDADDKISTVAYQEKAVNIEKLILLAMTVSLQLKFSIQVNLEDKINIAAIDPPRGKNTNCLKSWYSQCSITSRRHFQPPSVP